MLCAQHTLGMHIDSFRPVMIAAAVLCQGLGAAPAWAEDGYAIAGLSPHSRPAGAPVIKAYVKAADWRESALSGVSLPHPPGLGFLDAQGAWYTPFAHPGVPEPYDLRGWHARDTRSTGVRRESAR